MTAASICLYLLFMIRDLLWAVRWLRKNPLFTACAIVILSLGIGATTAVFSIVDAVLLRPLPYESSDRLLRIDETANRLVSGVPAADYLRWRDRSDLFEKTVPYLKDTVTLTGTGEPDQIVALRTSGALFPLLGVHARIGRALVESDDEPGSAKVAVISDHLWQRRFHADPGVIGRAITVSEEVDQVLIVRVPVGMRTQLRPIGKYDTKPRQIAYYSEIPFWWASPSAWCPPCCCPDCWRASSMKSAVTIRLRISAWAHCCW